MSDAVLVVIIVTVAVFLVLLLFQKRLRSFLFRADRDGIEAQLKVDKTAPKQKSSKSGTTVSGNKLIGRGNKVGARGKSVDVSENILLGENQELAAESTPLPPKTGRSGSQKQQPKPPVKNKPRSKSARK